MHGPFVINEAFARHFLPNVDPLAPTSPIVGVVKDVKLFGVKDDVGLVMFLVSRRPEAIGAVQVRAAGNPEAPAAIRVSFGAPTESQNAERRTKRTENSVLSSAFCVLCSIVTSKLSTIQMSERE